MGRQKELESLPQRKITGHIKKPEAATVVETSFKKQSNGGKAELQKRLSAAGSTLTETEVFVLQQTKNKRKLTATDIPSSNLNLEDELMMLKSRLESAQKSETDTNGLIVKLEKEIKNKRASHDTLSTEFRTREKVMISLEDKLKDKKKL